MRQNKQEAEKTAQLRKRICEKLEHQRETIRKMSPEDLEKRITELGGEVSASYIRRVEKGVHSPTIETLYWIVAGLGSNLGLFFEDFIEESSDMTAVERRCHRVLQRAMEGPEREATLAIVRLIERSHLNS